MRPWHEVLEVAPDAGPEDVRRAFRRLAVAHRDDRARFAEITAAYQAARAGWPAAPETERPTDEAIANVFRTSFGAPRRRMSRGLQIALVVATAALTLA